MIEVKLDEAALKQVAQLIHDTGPKARFAASVGLNRTMNEAQAAIQDGLAGKFTLRREQFVKNTIYRKPGEDFASKDKLVAGVRVNEQRDQLAKFEAGGEKRPTQAKTVAIPVDVRRNKNDITPKSQSVRALIASGKAYIHNRLVLATRTKRMRDTVLLYILKPSVRIQPQLKFVETGTKVIEDRAIDNITGAIQVELDRGLTSSSPKP